MPGGKNKRRTGGKPQEDKNEDAPSQQQEQQGQQFKFDFGTGNSGSAFAPVFDFSNPEGKKMLSAIQNQLGSLVGASSGYYESLPKEIRNRVRALKQLHKTKVQIDAEYKKARDELEKKFMEKYSPLYEKRAVFVSGDAEPTEEEMGPEEEDEKIKIEEVKEGTEKTDTKSEEAPKGIPEFWVTALRHHESLGDAITDRDAEALKYLKDVRCKVFQDFIPPKKEEGKDTKKEEEDVEEPLHGFTVEFYFDENPFFEDKVLTKTYYLTYSLSEEMFHHSDATQIKWKKDKNLTVEKVTKQQKPKKKGRGGRGNKGQPMKTVTVEEPTESFFHFFTPEGILGGIPEALEEMGDEEALLEEDYHYGLEIKESLIPDAVLHFTGEAPRDHPSIEFDDGEEEEEEEGEDEEYAPNQEKPAECKQQ